MKNNDITLKDKFQTWFYVLIFLSLFIIPFITLPVLAIVAIRHQIKYGSNPDKWSFKTEYDDEH